MCGPWGSFLNPFGVLTVAGDTVWLCTAGIGKVGWPRDGKRVAPVDGTAGNFISDSLANRPGCTFDVSGQRVVDAGIVSEYHFELCTIRKSLRNHHEGLRFTRERLVRCACCHFIQCLREGGRCIQITPGLCPHIVSPFGINVFQTDALYGTYLHVISAHEPDGGKGMIETKGHGSVGVAGQFIRLCHEKVFLVVDIARNSDADGGRTCLCPAGKYVLSVGCRSIGEELHFI